MQLTWDKIAAAEAKEEAKATPDEEKSSVAMKGGDDQQASPERKPGLLLAVYAARGTPWCK